MVEQTKDFATQIADEIVPEDSDLTETAYRLQWRLARDAAEAARARILAAMREPDAALLFAVGSQSAEPLNDAQIIAALSAAADAMESKQE